MTLSASFPVDAITSSMTGLISTADSPSQLQLFVNMSVFVVLNFLLCNKGFSLYGYIFSCQKKPANNLLLHPVEIPQPE